MAHILIVEDAPDNRTIAELILRDAGFSVTSVGDGASALIAAATKHPDVILMDLSLPHLDGWEATKRLKSDPATRDIPVIAFTAHALPNDIERARACGCSSIIAKPFEIDFFLSQIRAFIKQRPIERSRGMTA
jgi:two-component system cell cycle response regulator DivK